MRGFWVLAVAVIAVPARASAGRDYFSWLYGTEVLPERSAELMSWISEENDVKDEGHAAETRWWVGPLIGLTDQLELALPVEMSWDRALGAPTRNGLDRYGVELRWRMVTQDPVDAPAIVPLLRVGVKRIVATSGRSEVSPEVDAVVSYEAGIVQVLTDIGIYGEVSGDTHHFEVRPGAGVSVLAVGDLRFGAEIFAEIALDDGGSWAAVGPNFAWSHGRSWVSAAYGIGITGIKDAPKLQWGIAF